MTLGTLCQNHQPEYHHLDGKWMLWKYFQKNLSADIIPKKCCQPWCCWPSGHIQVVSMWRSIDTLLIVCKIWFDTHSHLLLLILSFHGNFQQHILLAVTCPSPNLTTEWPYLICHYKCALTNALSRSLFNWLVNLIMNPLLEIDHPLLKKKLKGSDFEKRVFFFLLQPYLAAIISLLRAAAFFPHHAIQMNFRVGVT